jgi:hypothetical protein
MHQEDRVPALRHLPGRGPVALARAIRPMQQEHGGARSTARRVEALDRDSAPAARKGLGVLRHRPSGQEGGGKSGAEDGQGGTSGDDPRWFQRGAAPAADRHQRQR